MRFHVHRDSLILELAPLSEVREYARKEDQRLLAKLANLDEGFFAWIDTFTEVFLRAFDENGCKYKIFDEFIFVPASEVERLRGTLFIEG
jgi:hypothetical protein